MSVVTKAFVLAIERSAEIIEDHVRDRAAGILNENPSPSVLTICNRVLEEDRQTADLIRGWAVRQRQILGMEKSNG